MPRGLPDDINRQMARSGRAFALGGPATFYTGGRAYNVGPGMYGAAAGWGQTRDWSGNGDGFGGQQMRRTSRRRRGGMGRRRHGGDVYIPVRYGNMFINW